MKQPINSRRKSGATSGSALVVALLVVVMVAALGAGLLQVSMSVTRRQSSEIEAQKAFYLAEAGLAEAFDAVRRGRTGQVGSETAPAGFGDGLLWVDATETANGHVRLESTGLHGRGRATLAYVLEPVDVPLGFFSDEDLVVEAVLLVDGFDSEDATYEEELLGDEVLVDRDYPFFHDDPVNQLVFHEGEFFRYYAVDGDTYYYDHSVTVAALAENPAYGPGTYYSIDAHDFVDHAPNGRLGVTDQSYDTTPDFFEHEYEGVLDHFGSVPAPDALSEAQVGANGPTTGGGGLLASNGDVRFQSPAGEPIVVYGDVQPGPGGAITGLDGASVTGATGARAFEVVLPEVEVPAVSMAPAVRHDGVLPLLVPPGTSGHERIEVAADAELVLRGPATIVIGELVLEPGALLTLDTRDGDVELYVTAGMDLQEGSEVTTSSDLPEQVSVQVAPIASVGAAPVQLDATSHFHGTIYAPKTEVSVGAEFEVYGGIVARKLEIGAGARLHFDNAGFEGSPIPRIVAWRIIEVPSAARGQGDIYELLGVTPGAATPLAEAHDLTRVWLTLSYLDHGGAERSFDGTEADFDWSLVAEVVKVERAPTRIGEEDGAPVKPPPIEDPPPKEDDQALLDRIADSSVSSADLASDLLAAGLLSDAVLAEAIRAEQIDSWDLYNVLLANGPVAPGYPGAKGDAPLADSLLLELIGSSYDTQAMSWTLEQNSPLSAGVLAAVQNREPPLPVKDLNYILRAQ